MRKTLSSIEIHFQQCSKHWCIDRERNFLFHALTPRKASRTARSNTRAAEHRALVQQQAENNENRALPNRRFVLIPPRQHVAELNAGRRVIIVDSTTTDHSNAQAPTAERVVVPDLPEHSNADSQNPNDILDIGGELSDIE